MFPLFPLEGNFAEMVSSFLDLVLFWRDPILGAPIPSPIGAAVFQPQLGGRGGAASAAEMAAAGGDPARAPGSVEELMTSFDDVMRRSGLFPGSGGEREECQPDPSYSSPDDTKDPDAWAAWKRQDTGGH